jgi:plasmid stabilization system protein ParE
MSLEYHPAVQKDFNDALDYYEGKAGWHVADRFEAEFRTSVAALKAGPTRFPFYQGSRLFRRVRLKNFPYVIVYRENPGVIRITLLKHERRHPLYERQRW